MSDLSLAILNELEKQSSNGNNIWQYNYSNDLDVKSDELRSVKELEENGYILIKAKALGYAVCELL